MEPPQLDCPQVLGKRKREDSSEETYVASAASVDLDEEQVEAEEFGPKYVSRSSSSAAVSNNAITLSSSVVEVIEVSSDEEVENSCTDAGNAQIVDDDSDSDVIILSARTVRALTITGSSEREGFKATTTKGPKTNASSLPQPIPVLDCTRQNPFTQPASNLPRAKQAFNIAQPFSFVPIAPQWLVRANRYRRTGMARLCWLEDFSPYLGERRRLPHPDTGDLPKYFPPLLYETVRMSGKVPRTSDEFFALFFDPEYPGDRAVWTRYREIEEEVWCKRWDQHPAFNQWATFSVGYTAGGRNSQEERLRVLKREWKTLRETVELAIERGWRTIQNLESGRKLAPINLEQRRVHPGKRNGRR